jgi:hypothetical protein
MQEVDKMNGITQLTAMEKIRVLSIKQYLLTEAKNISSIEECPVTRTALRSIKLAIDCIDRTYQNTDLEK